MKKEQTSYYKFSRYLREHFGCPVYKISVDAGFSCPNKDGKLSSDGCIFCDNRAFSPNTRQPPIPLDKQIAQGIHYGKKRYGAEKFIIYFQAHTNTYAPLSILRKKYDAIRKFENIVGIAIGTRPDCVNDEIMDIIAAYAPSYEIWLEYGLQSIHNTTLSTINRNHRYEDFLKAVAMAKVRNIKVCAHIIIGLPGESKNEVLATAKELGRLKVEGIKIHPLHVVRGTKLEQLYISNSYNPWGFNEFVDVVTEFLRYLWPRTTIQRIGADCPRQLLVAPLWVHRKGQLLAHIEKRAIEKGILQGDRSSAPYFLETP
jgi:radical SAM protein (TIGR01212 family)